MKKTLETYSEIATWLNQSIELLNGLEQTDDAKALEHLKQKYQSLITDWLREQNLAKIKFIHSRSIGIEYFNLGEKDEKIG
jgi:molybdopterin-guanine dinucleotide biosynthesis protein A